MLKSLLALLLLTAAIPRYEVGAGKAGVPGYLLFADQGVGNRVRPIFGIRHGPWLLRWRFDCRSAAQAHKKTVLQIAREGHLVGLVVSDGHREAAIVVKPSESPPNMGRALKIARHKGNSGSLMVNGGSRDYYIPIATACAWQIQVFVTPGSGNPRPVFLHTLSERAIRRLALTLDAVPSYVPISRTRAVQVLIKQRHVQPADMREVVLARVHALVPGVAANNHVCWVIVLPPSGMHALRLWFVDANSGKLLGLYEG